MAEYQMQEISFMGKDGKRVLYPRMVMNNQVDLEYLIKNIHCSSTFSPGDIVGLVKSLTQTIAQAMAEGHSVKVDGLGIFTPALALREGVERENPEKGGKKVNAASIYVENINFRADRQLIQETEQNCRLIRSRSKPRRSSKRYTPEQRLELARTYLKEHTVMRVEDYCQLTGLLHNSAAKELKSWAEDANNGITTEGRGSHKFYMLKK